MASPPVWLLVGVALAATCPADGADEPPVPPLADAPAGPDHLKQQIRVTTDTNAPSAVASGTNDGPAKSFTWDFHWKGWDGLHFELIRKTLLGHVRGITNVPLVHLEEVRMAGKIGGKIAVDAAAFVTGDEFTDFNDGVELRRARIYARGDCLVLIPVSYEIEVGYVPDQFYIENSFIEFHHLGFLGSLKVGQFQVPMSLENYGSSRDMMFMEAAAPIEALAPNVNAGWQVGRPVLQERMTWAFGMFTDSVGDDFGDATRDFGRVIARVTGLPLYEHDDESPNSQRLLHLGLSGSALYAGADTVQSCSRPESHIAPYVVNTGDVDANGSYLVGGEIAWVDGPLCVQSEYLHTWVPQGSGGTAQFDGFYVSASWFLTGESRPYNRQQGIFARVIPKRNFDFGHGGWGAWEVAGRYSLVDLGGEGVQGGRLWMLMAGVNWYLQPHVKWRFNYGFGHVSGYDPEGNVNIFQTRIELDF